MRYVDKVGHPRDSGKHSFSSLMYSPVTVSWANSGASSGQLGSAVLSPEKVTMPHFVSCVAGARGSTLTRELWEKSNFECSNHGDLSSANIQKISMLSAST